MGRERGLRSAESSDHASSAPSVWSLQNENMLAPIIPRG